MFEAQEDSFTELSPPHSKQGSPPRSLGEKTSEGSSQSQGHSFVIVKTPSSSASNEYSESSFERCQRSTIKHELRVKQRESLKFKAKEEVLKINEKTLKRISEGLFNLKKPQKVKIDLSHFMFAQEETQQLERILQHISPIKTLELMIKKQQKDSVNVIIQQIFHIFDNENLRGLESLKVDFSKSQIAEECVDYLNKEVFPKLISIKTFHISLFGSDVKNQIIQELAWSFKENFAEIEDFSCNLGLTETTEKGIIQFFQEMPKVKQFELDIGNCPFTDSGMNFFIKNTLTSMIVLEGFIFKIEATDVTKPQILDLFKNLPVSLKKLHLDLRWTRTTNEILKFFIDVKLPKLTLLEEAELKVDCTLASKKMREKIELINKKYEKNIDIDECLKYAEMVKARYLVKEDFDFITLEEKTPENSNY